MYAEDAVSAARSKSFRSDPNLLGQKVSVSLDPCSNPRSSSKSGSGKVALTSRSSKNNDINKLIEKNIQKIKNQLHFDQKDLRTKQVIQPTLQFKEKWKKLRDTINKTYNIPSLIANNKMYHEIRKEKLQLLQKKTKSEKNLSLYNNQNYISLYH